jgi:hypothetical protein
LAKSVQEYIKAAEDTQLTLHKKAADSAHAVDVAEYNLKIDTYERESKNEALSIDQRTLYAQMASAERIKLIQAEADYQEQVLEKERDKMIEQFPAIKGQIAILFAQMKQDIQTKAKIDTEAVVTIKVDDQKTGKEIQRAVQMWTTGISSAMSAAVALFTASTSEDIEKAVSSLGGAIGSIGESAGNAWVAAAGEIIQGIGSVFSVLDSEVDIWGNKARKLEKDRQEAIEQEQTALRASDQLIKDWLYSIGALDMSLMSPQQLRTTVEQTQKKQLEQFGTTAGVNITKTTPGDLSSAIAEFGIENILQAVYTGGGGTYNAILKKYPGLLDLFEQMDFKDMSKEQYAQVAKAMVKTYSVGNISNIPSTYLALKGTFEGGGVGGLAATAQRANTTLAGYQYTADLDHTRATSHEVFEEALNVEESQGKITALRHAQILYEMAYGLKDAIDGTNYSKLTDLLGVRFMDYYGPEQRNTFKKSYDDLLSAPAPAASSNAGGYGIPGAAEGGIFDTPHMISEYGQLEAAVPLGNPSRARSILDEINSILPFSNNGGNTHVTVECRIDPNIPFSQDVARNMSAQIGEIVAITLNGKGIR